MSKQVGSIDAKTVFPKQSILIGTRPKVDTWVSRAIRVVFYISEKDFTFFSQLHFHEISLKLTYFKIITFLTFPASF